MKFNSIFIALIIFSVLNTSCINVNPFDNKKTVNGNKNIIEKVIDFKNFTDIENTSIFDIIITQGENEEIKITTDENIMEYLICSQKNDKIFFSQKENETLQPTKAVISITMKKLNLLTNIGTGDVLIEKLSGSGNVIIENMGTGDIKFNTSKIETIEIDNAGTGDINLNGEFNQIKLTNSGTGDFNGSEITCKSANIINSGTGDVIIHADSELSLSNTGTGDIKYSGNAQITKQESTGTGEIIKK